MESAVGKADVPTAFTSLHGTSCFFFVPHCPHCQKCRHCAYRHARQHIRGVVYAHVKPRKADGNSKRKCENPIFFGQFYKQNNRCRHRTGRMSGRKRKIRRPLPQKNKALHKFIRPCPRHHIFQAYIRNQKSDRNSQKPRHPDFAICRSKKQCGTKHKPKPPGIAQARNKNYSIIPRFISNMLLYPQKDISV